MSTTGEIRQRRKRDCEGLKHSPQLWCWGWAYSTLSPSTNSHSKQANDT